MPTERARHSITETDEVARALRRAERHWPEAARRPARLLLELVRAGHRAIEADGRSTAEQRRDAIRRTKGILTGCYPEGYLEDLQGEWPA